MKPAGRLYIFLSYVSDISDIAVVFIFADDSTHVTYGENQDITGGISSVRELVTCPPHG